jgi:hypothetical protein
LHEVRSDWTHREGRAQVGGKKTSLEVGVDVRHAYQKCGVVVSLQVLRTFLERCGGPSEVTAICVLHIVHPVHVDFPYDEVVEGEKDSVLHPYLVLVVPVLGLIEFHFCWTLSAVEIVELLARKQRASDLGYHPKSCPLSGEHARELVVLAHSESRMLQAFVPPLSHSAQLAVHHQGDCG